MDFEFRTNSAQTSSVAHLLQQAKVWQQLDAALKKDVPISLQHHFKVVCIQKNTLFLYANSTMAASRLKMLAPNLLAKAQSIDDSVLHIKIKILPTQIKKEKKEQFQLNHHVLNAFEQTAHALNHQPKLAQALLQLVNHQLERK